MTPRWWPTSFPRYICRDVIPSDRVVDRTAKITITGRERQRFRRTPPSAVITASTDIHLFVVRPTAAPVNKPVTGRAAAPPPSRHRRQMSTRLRGACEIGVVNREKAVLLSAVKPFGRAVRPSRLLLLLRLTRRRPRVQYISTPIVGFALYSPRRLFCYTRSEYLALARPFIDYLYFANNGSTKINQTNKKIGLLN